MEIKDKGILPKNFTVNEKYSVMLFIKKGSNAETYRVKGNDGKLYFLKLFNIAKLHRSAFDNENNLLEIEFLKKAKHENIVSYKDNGEIIHEGKKYMYLVLDFIAGETLTERISREQIATWYDVKQIITDVLQGLDYLHNLPKPIIHNEITPQNIMLDLSGNSPRAVIIDFGFARSFLQPTKAYNKEGLNLNYVASECFNNLFSVQSDIYSVGAVMYHLLFGMPPWAKDISKFHSDRTKAEESILEQRKRPLSIPELLDEMVGFEENSLPILKKALQQEPDERFPTALQFIQALNGEIEVTFESKSSQTKQPDSVKTNPNKGKGFMDIAGMQELKEKLKNDVIDLINDPEGAKQYNLSMPNGMLLYGPPGCGKTYFAQKFAEETGFSFKYVNPSDLGSIYVHGSQEKIGKLFKEARENAPYIICLDEVSSIFPKRENTGNHQVGEVDEFLTQLNNCGQDGIFVIALTNFPENIDDAILRAGRIDIKIFVSPPDFLARKALFEMYLKNIPKDFGIDYDRLSNLTENYVSSDIKLIIQEIGRNLRQERGRVTQELLENKIRITNPSVKLQVLQKHEQIRKELESGKHQINERKRIGFKP